MHLVRFVDNGGNARLGQDLGSGVIQPLDGNLFGKLMPCGEPTQVSKLLPPFKPVNIFCIGLNYREHAKELGVPDPTYPVVFTKPTSTVIGPGDAIRIPSVCSHTEVDYEAELAVVIGRKARDVSEVKALDYVFGYTAANDVSARTWQLELGGGQWIRGKGFDTFCPLGPVLVTADEISDPQALAIRTILNDQVMQDHTTGDMIFSVAQLISFLSQDTTLLPGTVILTGTPQGVGFTRKPEVWLKDGDEVVVEIEKIGRLVNPVNNA
jgi:2-keto-4-pentenoate hydratase/2-oxohepta-3-ene-1,7-dioic acid hydratase in catechol pathway